MEGHKWLTPYQRSLISSASDQIPSQRSSNLNEGEALAVHSLGDPTQNATDKVGSSGLENATPMILAYTTKALIAPYLGCTDVSKYPTKSWISRLRDV